MENKQYETFFHKLHCLLRDGELGLTGLSALNEINNIIFYIFIESSDIMKLEENIKFSKLYDIVINIDNHNYASGSVNYKYYKLLENYNNNLIKLFQNENCKKYVLSDTNGLTSFRCNRIDNEEDLEKKYSYAKQLYDLLKTTKDFFFGNITLNSTNITKKFKEINTDILGDAYEKFKEDEVGNQGKNTGQYFTPRTIIKYIIEKQIKPKDTDLSYDSSCGTGGFIHYLDKYVKNNKGDIINFRNNIYGNDKNSELMKPLYINMFLHNIPVNHIYNRNSLSKKNCMDHFQKFDVIVGNPPFGVKNIIKNNDTMITDKQNYWPKFMQSSKELVKDSMGQFIIHTINSLKVGGRFSLVMDRGILNNGTDSNSWQKKLRQFILTVCEIQSIILLPKGIFTHTMFDTAIMYGIKKVAFDDYYDFNHILPNKISTQKLNFYIGDFEDESNKKGLCVPDECMTLDMKDIVNKDWSLKYDDYIEKEEMSYNGIQYKTLGQVCDMHVGNFKTKDFKNNGNIPFYCGLYNSPIGNFNESTIELKTHGIIFTKGGGCHTSLYSGSQGYCNSYLVSPGKIAFCSPNICFYNIKINYKYLFYFLKLYKNNLRKDTKFSANLGSLKKSYIEKLKIPILPNDHQQRIVDFMDKFIGDDYKLLDRMVSEFKNIDMFKFLLKEDYNTMETCIEIIKEQLDYENRKKRLFLLHRKLCFKSVSSEYKTLGQVCEFDIGSTPSTKNSNYFGGNILWANISDLGPKYISDTKKKLTKIAIEENNLKLVKKGTLMMSFKLSIGKLSIANNDMYCNEAIAFFKNYKDINNNYLYYVLSTLDYNKQKYLFNSQIGLSLNKSTLAKLKIPVPSLEDQEKVVKMIEQIDNEESKIMQAIDGMKVAIQYIYDSTLNENLEKETYEEPYEEPYEDEHEEEPYEEMEEHEKMEEPYEDEHDEKQDEKQDIEYEIITHKQKTYYLHENKLYKIKNNKLGKLYGTFKNDKIIKI